MKSVTAMLRCIGEAAQRLVFIIPEFGLHYHYIIAKLGSAETVYIQPHLIHSLPT